MRPEVTDKKILSLKERFGVTVAIAAEFSGISSRAFTFGFLDGSGPALAFRCWSGAV